MIYFTSSAFLLLSQYFTLIYFHDWTTELNFIKHFFHSSVSYVDQKIGKKTSFSSLFIENDQELMSTKWTTHYPITFHFKKFGPLAHVIVCDITML